MNSKSTLFTAMIISMVFWGLSWPSAKVITAYSNPVNLTAYRYAVVFITLLPLLIIFKIPMKISKRGIPFVVIAGSLLALYSYAMFEGLKNGYAGAGGVLVTTLNPIMAYSLSLLLQWKKPSRNEGIGLLLGLIAGCVLLRIWDNADAIFQSGNLFFLGSAFLWATMSRFTARSHNYGSPFSFSLWMYFVTLLVLIPFIDVADLKHTLTITDFFFWANLFFGGAIVTSLATTIYFYATSRIGSDKASSFIFLVPFAAAVSSWLLLGEKIEMHTLAGGILGIGAVYMMQRKSKS
ncbi:MAG: DMT family transporter [Bacteroidota bacterium]